MCIKVIHEMSVNLAQSTLFFTVMLIVCFGFFKLPCKNLHAHVNLFMRWVIQPHVNLFMRWVIQPHVNLFMRWVIQPHVNLYEVNDTTSCEPLYEVSDIASCEPLYEVSDIASHEPLVVYVICIFFLRFLCIILIL